jgi:hypothetical protein
MRRASRVFETWFGFIPAQHTIYFGITVSKLDAGHNCSGWPYGGPGWDLSPQARFCLYGCLVCAGRPRLSISSAIPSFWSEIKHATIAPKEIKRLEARSPLII